MIAALPYADDLAGSRLRQSPTRPGDHLQELNDGIDLAALGGAVLLRRAGGVATGRQLRLRGKAGGQTGEPVGARAKRFDPALKGDTSGRGLLDVSS
jgi:hypothetical protein